MRVSKKNALFFFVLYSLFLSTLSPKTLKLFFLFSIPYLHQHEDVERVVVLAERLGDEAWEEKFFFSF